MDKIIDHHYGQLEHYSFHQMNATDRLVRGLSLSPASELEPIEDIKFSHKLSNEHNYTKEYSSYEKKIESQRNKHDDVSDNQSNARTNDAYSGDLRSIFDRVNNLCDSLSRNLISHEEFTRLMEQVRKDKEELEEVHMKKLLQHRIDDYQGMLSVFEEGSQAFLATKVAISQLSSML